MTSFTIKRKLLHYTYHGHIRSFYFDDLLCIQPILTLLSSCFLSSIIHNLQMAESKNWSVYTLVTLSNAIITQNKIKKRKKTEYMMIYFKSNISHHIVDYRPTKLSGSFKTPLHDDSTLVLSIIFTHHPYRYGEANSWQSYASCLHVAMASSADLPH